MKNPVIIISAGLMFLNLTLNSQTKQDSLSIENACRNYIEGWAEGNVERVAKGVSPELVKRSVSSDKDGFSYISDMSGSLLLYVTKLNKGGIRITDLEPGVKFKTEVIIYDITTDMALAKTVTKKFGFFDYCQLAKVNGEWKIINVLWGWLPKKN